MSKTKRIIVYNEPGAYDQVVRSCCSIDEAIKRMKMSAYKAKGYIYTSDKEALADFMAVHWAWFEEE